uniref:Uncharacterized protein n=1 Tax=Anguilla anguilla TaxID=7936 RepID=A0A0E9QJK8_ANGAN
MHKFQQKFSSLLKIIIHFTNFFLFLYKSLPECLLFQMDFGGQVIENITRR